MMMLYKNDKKIQIPRLKTWDLGCRIAENGESLILYTIITMATE
jgi:hypothetical protein